MELSNKIINVINKKNIKNPQLEILCIGTDRITGDSLGPIVGSNINEYINKENIKNVNVLGSLEKPLNNITINEYKKSEGKVVIVIDSAVSNTYKIGEIVTKENNIIIRNALKDDKIIPSDICIKAVVSRDLEDEELNFIMLQNVKLNIVMNLSKKISEELIKAIENFNS